MKLCSVEGCNNEHYGGGYCNKHYQQIRTYGIILERTKNDPNVIIVEDSICRMKLYNFNDEIIIETIFDLKYKKEVEKYKWCIANNRVKTNLYDENGHHGGYLHQLIIQLSGKIVSPGEEIDHKDLNPLNNLESNLRICTHAQNLQNRNLLKNNTSGQKGVSWRDDCKKWSAYIYHNKKINLGTFNTKKEASQAYNKAAIKYFGELANLNIIEEEELNETS